MSQTEQTQIIAPVAVAQTVVAPKVNKPKKDKTVAPAVAFKTADAPSPEEDEDALIRRAEQVMARRAKEAQNKERMEAMPLVRADLLAKRTKDLLKIEQEIVALRMKQQDLTEQVALYQDYTDKELFDLIAETAELEEEAFPKKTVKKVEAVVSGDKKVKKLPEYVRPPNYPVLYIPASTILVARLMGTEWKLKYDGKSFINQATSEVYETLRKATIAHQIAVGAKSIPDAWTHWKTADGQSIARLDITPLK